jgi:hypothetical protein
MIIALIKIIPIILIPLSHYGHKPQASGFKHTSRWHTLLAA